MSSFTLFISSWFQSSVYWWTVKHSGVDGMPRDRGGGKKRWTGRKRERKASRQGRKQTDEGSWKQDEWKERSPETEKSRGETQCRQTDMTFFHCGLASRHRTEEGFVSWGASPPPLPFPPLHDWVWVRACLMLSWLHGLAVALQQQATPLCGVNTLR